MIEAVDLLDIEKLVVGHDGPGDGKGWHLKEAKLKVPIPAEEKPEDGNANNSNNKEEVQYKEYSFPCDR